MVNEKSPARMRGFAWWWSEYMVDDLAEAPGYAAQVTVAVELGDAGPQADEARRVHHDASLEAERA